jgi:hypothetical protein
MPEPRTIEQVRAELESERELLEQDVAVLRKEAHALLPYAAGGVAALALLTRSRRAFAVLARGKSLIQLYRLLRLFR